MKYYLTEIVALICILAGCWLGWHIDIAATYLFTEGYRYEMVGGYSYDGWYHVPRHLRYWPVTLPAKIKCYYRKVKEAAKCQE